MSIFLAFTHCHPKRCIQGLSFSVLLRALGKFEARARSQQFFTFTALVVCHLSWTAAPSLLSVSRQQFTSFFLVKDVNTSYSWRDDCRLCETLTPSKSTVVALLPVRMSLCYISCVITLHNVTMTVWSLVSIQQHTMTRAFSTAPYKSLHSVSLVAAAL